MDTLPVEVISKILSFLPLTDRVKCESINWQFNYICKDLWLLQTSINENELPPIRWIKEFQTIQPDVFAEARSNFFRWKMTLKCPRIERITIDDEEINSTFFIERVPFLKHLIVRKCSENFAILTEAKRLQTIAFERSDCNEYAVIQHLPDTINSIEGPSICDPWIDQWDEFFEHPVTVRFQNLVTLTVVISLQTIHQFNNLVALDRLTHIRFLSGDESDKDLLVKYLEQCGSKLKGLELFQPLHLMSCRNVYTAINNNCTQLTHLGMKGYFHGKDDYIHFKMFLFNFKSLETVSLNIPRALTEDEVVTVCGNNPNLRNLNYTYYMSSISPQKLKVFKRHCRDVELLVETFNSQNPVRRKIVFDTSQVIKRIISGLSS